MGREDRRNPRPEGDDVWYRRGLSFACTSCGNCCSGPSGTVRFNRSEADEMARVLGVEVEEFYARYATLELGKEALLDDQDEDGIEEELGSERRGRWTLREIEIGERDFDCVFLDREKSPPLALCRIYEARPAQCRTWPFWPSNLRSDRSWYWVKRNTPCPGMDRGPTFSLEEIEEQRQEAPQDL